MPAPPATSDVDERRSMRSADSAPQPHGPAGERCRPAASSWFRRPNRQGSPRHSAPQRTLRLVLAAATATGGGAWGAVALSLAHHPDALAVLTGHAEAAQVIFLLVLLAALPVGALAGAMPLDLVSRHAGRRPASLACAALVAVGSLLGLVTDGWGQCGAALVIGLGLGGYAVVTPKLAHELAERGHARLIPRLTAAVPAGAGLALLVGQAGGLAGDGAGLALAWVVPLLGALAAALGQVTLPETPHWYAAHGRLEAAVVALTRMVGPLEAAVGIDWVMMDAGMHGEQRPVSASDLRVARVRRTVMVGGVLEVLQLLPLGLAGICLSPALIALVGADAAVGPGLDAHLAGGLGGAGGAGVLPLWSGVLLAVGWLATALVALWRRSERLRMAWVMVGLGAAACATCLLLLVPQATERSAADGQAVVVSVAVLVAVAQYVCVAPACTGGTDPLVPPWLLRSQRRAQAVARPVVQLVTVLGPTALLASGLPAAGVVAVCLTGQVLGLVALLGLAPRVSAALR